MTGLAVSASARTSMLGHARSDLGHEVCGVLLGGRGEGGARVDRVMRGRNRAGDRSHRYEMHPADLVLGARLAREAGLEVLGFYHTHPAGEARPSRRDLEASTWWDPSIQIILAPESPGIWHMKAWAAHSGDWAPIPVSRGPKIF